MVRVLALVVLVIAALVAATLLYAGRRWRDGTEELRTRIEQGRVPIIPAAYDPRELGSLPPPVQDYFRAVLEPGAPMIAAVRLRHAGSFNVSDTSQRWVPFSSDQRVVLQRPGFDWDARVRMAPGLTIRVHDAYVRGEGLLHAVLLAVFPVAVQRGTREVAEGELMRFLAEAVWYPTALLPSQGVRWEPVGERTAIATLRDGATTVSLRFGFGENGLIETVRSENRPRALEGRNVRTPWEGRWSDWELRDGVRIPTRGEVSWVPASGALPYWRGTITGIEYERAR